MNKERKKLSKAYQIHLFVALTFVGFSLLHGEAFAQKNPHDLKTNAEFIDAVKYYRYLNPDSALLFVKAGLDKAVNEHDKLGEAALLNQYGMIEDNEAKYQDAREKYLKAETIYRKEHDENGLASTLIRLGVVAKRKGNYNKAIEFFFEALKLSEKNKNKLGILEARVVLSEVYFNFNDLENCLKNLQLAQQIDSTMPVSNFSLNMYSSLGNFYTHKKQYQKAIQYLKIGLSKSNRIEYNGLKIGLLRLLGIAYSQMGDFKNADKALQEAFIFSKKIKNVLREQTILLDLANLYAKKYPDSALYYLNEAFKIVDSHNMSQQKIVVINEMSNIYKGKGDFKRALSLTEQSYKLSEEVYYKDMIKQISSLESAYELEKSNAQLSELKLKNSRENLVYNIVLSIAIGITLLFIITLVYFYRSRHLNKLLKQANHKLENSNNEKDKFFSIVAHDIRSPLASTISVLKFIANRELDDETQDDVVTKLASHCESSLEVLDKLLKWGQMQIKGARINIVEFDPIKNINSSMGLLKEAAEHKNISVTLEVPENICVKADSDHFDFVVRNLLANAIKFTSVNGLINLKVEIQKGSFVSFKISDNGVGISENKIEKLFELSAIGTKGTSEEEGTSLGLLICKEFIDANGGTLKVKSTLGQGTSFTFTLPGRLDDSVAKESNH